jgi:hypothetical protein
MFVPNDVKSLAVYCDQVDGVSRIVQSDSRPLRERAQMMRRRTASTQDSGKRRRRAEDEPRRRNVTALLNRLRKPRGRR